VMAAETDLANLEGLFEDDAVLAGSDLNVEQQEGIVTLEGEVSSRYQRDYAEDLVATQTGVTSVRNNLEVADEEGSEGTAQQLIESVEREFFWSWNVDGEDIQVQAQDGTVTLTGQVDSVDEFNAATENAYEAGATQVLNRTIIRPEFGGPTLFRDREWWGEEAAYEEYNGYGVRDIGGVGAVDESGTGSIDTGVYVER